MLRLVLSREVFTTENNIASNSSITQLQEFIDNTVIELFNNSKNFKVVQYAFNTTFIDTMRNTDSSCPHIIKFKQADDGYEYIFAIINNGEILRRYSTKIVTKVNLINALNKSVALIENIDEYKEYAEELQSITDTL